MAFSGTVTSDFLKYIPSDVDQKERLIDYSAGDYQSIRNALINYAKALFPLDYTNFSESDFGMFLIELMAATGHIQSIKSDFLANESFLRTARNRASVKKLLELIGIRLKGPISAAANASIEISLGDAIGSVSSVEITPENRVFTVASPEDGDPLTYTIYKVNSNGTVDLDQLTRSAIWDVEHLDGDPLVVTNAVILEGALVIESGVFQSSEESKSIALTQTPYIEKSCQVFIEGSPNTQGVYTEEDNIFFASGGSDKVFQITTDDQGTARVVFGDGILGLDPAVGDAYTVIYRVGGGTRGNIANGVLNVPVEVLVDDGVQHTAQATVENTSKATGGANAETVAHAKRYAPLTFRRQDRLVTLLDYKSFVNSFISGYGSTGKANAVVRRAYSSANIIDVFVLERASDIQLRKATPEYKQQLLEAISEKKMLTDEPVVVDGLIRTMDVVIKATCDTKYKFKEDDIKIKLRDKILTYFNVDNTDYGESFIPQDLVRSVVEIPEVRYAVIENIPDIVKVDFNEIIQLNNLTINLSYL